MSPDRNPSGPGGDLRLCDGIAPFFSGLPHADTNWSKAPFTRIEDGDRLPLERVEAISAGWEEYLAAMSRLGYNAVAVDDLAHAVSHPWYSPGLRGLLADYRALYRRLMDAAHERGFGVYLASDYCFYNAEIESRLESSGESPREFFAATVAAALRDWPELAGVILRIGESDGVDVRDRFTSRLGVACPREARELVERLLPVFEGAGASLIVRTWSLGAHPIGDLMWNPATFDAVFEGIESEALIVSMKYGESDFFRYLDLNPLLLRGPHRKLVEFQARREYEGMGEFPAFVGRLHEGQIATLRAEAPRIAGCSVVMAGGWAPWSRLAFTSSRSVWNELNAAVISAIWQGSTCDEAIDAWRRANLPSGADQDSLLRFLDHADRAIEQGLYIRQFAEQRLYARRVHLPPLLWVFWRDVTATGLVALLHRFAVRDRAAAIAEGHAAVGEVLKMRSLAPGLGLPVQDLDFQLATFRLLALAREVLLGSDSLASRRELVRLLPEYERRYPGGYRFSLPGPGRSRLRLPPAPLFSLVLRRTAPYRLLDRIMLAPPMAVLIARLARLAAPLLPAFVNRQGMSPDVLLR